MKFIIKNNFCKYSVEYIEKTKKYAITKYDCNACMLSDAMDSLWNPLNNFDTFEDACKYMNENINVIF